MSPEQARGQAVDKRTDIWAFGCVLYEMLTGRRAFSGETISDTIAAVLNASRTGRRCLQRFRRCAAARAPLLAEGSPPPDPRHRGCARRDRRGVGRRERAGCLADTRDLGEPPDARGLVVTLASPRLAIAGRMASPIAVGRSIGSPSLTYLTLPLPDGVGLQSPPAVRPTDRRSRSSGAMAAAAVCSSGS